jgi:lysophospholipase L1-like esterase
VTGAQASPRARVRIVVLADSLAMPRDEGGARLLWEETWPYRLDELLRRDGLDAEVLNCGSRARRADHIHGTEFLEHVAYKRPDVVCLEVGIVDCAPRVFSKREKRLLNRRWFPRRLRERIVASRSRRRPELIAPDPLRKVDTRPEEFERLVRLFERRLRELEWKPKLILVPILSDPRLTEPRSPGHTRNVELYNDALRRVARETGATFVEPETILRTAEERGFFFPDGYHLTAPGCQRLAERVAAAVNEVLAGR